MAIAQSESPNLRKDPVLSGTSEVIGPAVEDTRPEGIRREELEPFVARITGHLKAAGATEEDIWAALPGLVSARLALDPVEAFLSFFGLFVLMAVPGIYFLLADNPEFIRG